jgi:hypothetical protein
VPFPSSQMRREPSWATATPTGRAQTEESFASPAAFPEMRSSRATRAANGATFSMASQTATAQRLAGTITRSISWIALSRSVKNMRPN